jgi:CBS domain containing-hemolysin-like protein
MTPREAIDMVDANLETKELIDRIIETGHRRVPLYIGTLDNVVGIAYTKDLLMMLRYERVIILQDCLSQPHFVEEETRVIDLLRAFQHSDIHLAIVRNKEKRVVGLVDLDDLFGEIVGEIVRERALPVP